MIRHEGDRAGTGGDVPELSTDDNARAALATGRLESLRKMNRNAHPPREHWEPLDPYQRMWGVINVEGLSACPIALFVHEDDAKGWIAQLTVDCDSVAYRGNPVYLKALPVRRLAGELWNSYEPAPAEPG